MANASRRGLLAGLAASPVALAAGATPTTTPDVDAELRTLLARFREADRALDAAFQAQDDAADRFQALGGTPELPEALFAREGDREMFLHATDYIEGRDWKAYSDTHIRHLRSVPRRRQAVEPHPELSPPNVRVRQVPWPEAQARADEIVAAWDARTAEDTRRREASGHAAACNASDLALEAYHAARTAVIEAPARSIEGALLKCAIMLEAFDDPSDLDATIADVAEHGACSRVAMAIVRDLAGLHGLQVGPVA